MTKSKQLTRRKFLGQGVSVGAASIVAPYVIPEGVLARPGRPGANDRIQVGLIGAGGQGNWHLSQLLAEPNAVVTAVCDVWKERLDKAIGRCNGTAKPYHHYRELLRRDDVDAVLIATLPPELRLAGSLS